MSNILITICARDGSKGCPGKHTRLIAGKPLIQWTMEHASEWRELNHGKHKVIRVVVSTDDSNIVALAVDFGLEWVEQRPAPTDVTPKVPAIRNAALDTERVGKLWDIIIDLDATAPLRTMDDIDGALASFRRGEWDCVLSATVGVGRNPYFNLLEFGKFGIQTCKPYIPDGRHGDIAARQQAPQVFAANSSIYVYSRRILRADVTSPLDGRCGVYVMPDESFYHVDSELDFKIVDFLMKERHGV